MRIESLLLTFALSSVCLPLYSAPPAPPGPPADNPARGVPFERLQQQIDKLRQRVERLEAASPAGQTCPTGQFVTGFNSAGTILCANTSGGTPTPVPAPNPISDSYRAALQQAFDGLAGQNVPIQMPPSTFGNSFFSATVEPLAYDLAIGTVQIALTSATSATIQVAVPSIAVHANVSISGLLGSGSGTVTLTTSASTVTIVTSIATTASGNRRLGAVTLADFVPGPLVVTGNNAFVVSTIQRALPSVEAVVASGAELIVTDAVNQILPTLPEF